MSDSAAAVRRFRDRLRSVGLVKKDVWILPEHAQRLAEVEQILRQQDATAPLFSSTPWTVETLHESLGESIYARSGLLHVSKIEGAEPSLRISMNLPGLGQQDVFLAVGGEQILVEVFLWPVTRVRDQAEFNECILRTHKFIPLSTFSITDVAGIPMYTMFGSLDVRSSLESVIFEIQSLADAVMSLDALYADYLKQGDVHD